MQDYKKLISEMVGTAFLMFAGCMGGLSWNDQAPTPFFGCFCCGLVVMIIVQCYGHISGTHLNPAISIAAVVLGRLSIPMAILYSIAQMIGAILGFGLLRALTPAKVFASSCGEYGFCQTVPNEDLSEPSAFFIEFIATSVLISICCSFWDPNNIAQRDTVALKFGLTVMVEVMIFGPFTGCSMNPVRTFAPAFWAQNYPAHWIYWTAPTLSALCTSITYKIIFWEKSQNVSDTIKTLRDHDELSKV